MIETDATNCMNLPAEALEMEAPIRLNRVALRRDSGGAGEWRGGLGVVREYEVLEGDVSFSHRGERHFSAASGLAGGQDGAMARSLILRADGREEMIRSKIAAVLHAGRPGGCRDRRRRRLWRPGAALGRPCRGRHRRR